VKKIMPLLQEALTLLEESALKNTERRVRLIELMYTEDRYITPTEVKELLKKDYPNISPDTVYRNLHSFSDIDLLEETEISGEKHFRANCETEDHHHHFICEECGYSVELTACPLTFFKEQIGEAEVTSHRFELFGLCEACTAQKAVN